MTQLVNANKLSRLFAIVSDVKRSHLDTAIARRRIMSDIHVWDSNPPAKEIEKVLRTQGAEAALNVFIQCEKEAQGNPDYKSNFNEMKKTLVKDGLLPIISLQWANDRSKDMLSGEKSVSREDLRKALNTQRFFDGDNGKDPDLDANLTLGDALMPQIDATKGLELATLPGSVKDNTDAFLDKGGGMKNDDVMAVKKLLDDGDNGSKLYLILKGNSDKDGITTKSLDNFLKAAQDKDSDYLKSLGYKPDEYAAIIKAVKSVRDHFDQFKNSDDCFKVHDVAVGLGFTSAADMWNVYRHMDGAEKKSLNK